MAVRKGRGKQLISCGASPNTLVALVMLSASLLLPGCGRDASPADNTPPPIEIKATVHPAQSMTIASQIDGQVQGVTVREGGRVEAGVPIVQLANPAVERDAAAARAQLNWIDARLRRGGRPATRTAPAVRPSGNLEITAKILDLKRNRFEKMKDLRRTRDITARELEFAEVEYLAALRDYNNERRAYMGAAGTSAAAASEDPELLRIEREKTAADEKFAAQRLGMLQVSSPIAGVVTRVHVAPGQSIFPRDPVADVSNLSTMHVRGNLAPELLRYVRPGMRVDVRILSVPPRTFADEIEQILPVQEGGSRGATVVVAIPNPDGSLQPNTEALITLRSLR